MSVKRRDLIRHLEQNGLSLLYVGALAEGKSIPQPKYKQVISEIEV